MKRKVSQIGPATLMVSLPAKWARKYGIKKGNEIDIEEDGNKLVIGGKGEKTKRLTIDVSGSRFMLGRVIGAAYKAGYHELEITFSSPEEYEIIQKELNKSLAGFEIVRMSKNHLMIKELSELKIGEFDKVFRRLFLFLLDTVQEGEKAIENNDENALGTLVLRDLNLNKLCDYCRRALNIMDASDTKKITSHYALVEQLEKIGDMYKAIFNLIINDKINVSKHSLKSYLKLNQYLKKFHDLYYDFNLVELDELGKMKKKLTTELKSISEKVSQKERSLIFSLTALLNSIFDMNGVLIMSKI